MDLLFQVLGRVILTAYLTRLGEGKAVRYRQRNAAGRCALCDCAAVADDMRRMNYSSWTTVSIPGLDVCTPCIARRRRLRRLLWIVLLSMLVLLPWWSITHR